MSTIRLPFNWQPRKYQWAAWNYLQSGGKRAVLVCHRRWGKDDLVLHSTAAKSQERVATYWHMLPKANQARKAIWNAVNPHTGRRRIDEAFPDAIRDTVNEQEMFIRFRNGSTWQVVGSDNYDALVGAPPAGLVVSEWALANPAAWAYLEPILLENNGWAVFIFTSRGKNHGYTLFQSAKHREGWYAELSDADKTGVFTPEQLADAKQSLVDLYGPDEGEALFLQEYYCRFDTPVMGAYYGRQLSDLDKQGRLIPVPWEPTFPVVTAWDLGIDDMTAVWFAQVVGFEVRVIDYAEYRGKGLTEIAAEVLKRPYTYADHFMPHDVDQRELTTGKARKRALEDVGLRPIRVTPRLPVADGINAARNLLPKCVFDEIKCAAGLDALRSYRKEWDEEAKTFKPTPLHDWASHAADAFRCLALNVSDRQHEQHRRHPPQAVGYNPIFDELTGRGQWRGWATHAVDDWQP